MKIKDVAGDSSVASLDQSTQEPALTGRRLAFGAGAVGIVNVVKVVVQVLALPIMAKLLTPSEFGLYALAAPTVAFAVTLADGGLGASLAREPETSTVVWSTAFWVLLFTGLGLAVGVSAWGVIMGVVTHQPRLPLLIALMSVSLILMTVTAPSGARLTRRGRLGTEAASDLFATITGLLLAVIAARSGAGAFSLAIQYIYGFGVRAIWINMAAFELPTLEFQLSSLKSHLITGSSIIGQKLVDFAERLAGGALLSRLLGPVSLGQYTFSTQVAKFSTQAITNPTWATLYVKAVRDGVQSTIPLYSQLCRFLGILLLPGSFIAAAAAPQLVALILGPQWAPAALVLRVVLPTYALSAISAQVGALLLAHGRNDLVLWSSVIVSVARMLAILSGHWLGLLGIAFGVAAANLCYCVIVQIFANRVINCGPRQLMFGLIGPLTGAAAGTITFLSASVLLSPSLALLMINICFATLVAVTVLTFVDLKRLKGDVAAIRSLMKS